MKKRIKDSTPSGERAGVSSPDYPKTSILMYSALIYDSNFTEPSDAYTRN